MSFDRIPRPDRISRSEREETGREGKPPRTTERTRFWQRRAIAAIAGFVALMLVRRLRSRNGSSDGTTSESRPDSGGRSTTRSILVMAASAVALRVIRRLLR